MNISNKHIFNEGIISHGIEPPSVKHLPGKLYLRCIYDVMKAPNSRGKKPAPASEVLLFMVRGKRLLIGELN